MIREMEEMAAGDGIAPARLFISGMALRDHSIRAINSGIFRIR